MRIVRLTVIVAAVFAASACSESMPPSGPDLAPAGPRFDGGIYMGSGLSADTTDSTAPDSTDERGSGYIGTGL